MTRSRRSTFRRLTLSAGLAFGTAAASHAQPPAGAAPADPFAAPEAESFLLVEPTTAEEYFRAAVQAQRLARPNLALNYLRGFLATNPDDELLLRLRDDYGPAVFARLANQRGLQPLSTELATRVAEVFRRRGADPVRIDSLIDALDGPPDVAFPAREALVNAGDTVIPQILLRLPEADEPTARALLDVLTAMGGEALGPLHAALEARSDTLKVQALTVIGRIGSRESVPHLYFPAYGPDRPVAVQAAARRALAEIGKTSAVANDVTDPADVAARLAEEAVTSLTPPPADPTATPTGRPGIRAWSWDATAGTVRAADLDARSAALFRGVGFARQAFLLAPDRADTQALYLAFLLGSEAAQAGTSLPPAGPGTAFNAALAAGPDVAAEILRQALRYDIPRAGVAALAVLAETGSPSLLFRDDLIAQALDSTDGRVQLAAAATVVSLNPDRPFPRATRVVEILSRALADSPQPTAVIIDPDAQRGSTIAGFVSELGFDVAYTSFGQQGFSTAARQVRPAVILVNLNVSRWPLSQTLANIRADARTADIPVIVYGPDANEWDPQPLGTRLNFVSAPGANDPRSAVRRAISQVPGTAYVVETTTSAAFAAQVRPVLDQLVTDPLTPAERVEGRAVAAFRLAQIADTGMTDRFPLEPAEPALIGALLDPTLVENALIALAAIPTETAQRAIADFVLAPTADGVLRPPAANALTSHVRRFGILLPKPTVLELRRLWESTTDPTLRTALTTWGGTLRPGSERVRYQLESIAPPALPAPAAP